MLSLAIKTTIINSLYKNNIISTEGYEKCCLCATY